MPFETKCSKDNAVCSAPLESLEHGINITTVLANKCFDLFPTLCELAGLETPESVQGRSFAGLLSEPEKKISDVVYTRFKSADTVVTERFTYTLYQNVIT